MWSANLKQVYRVDAHGEIFRAWVVFLRLGADTRHERAIRSMHEEIDGILADQNVLYTEITTQRGKGEMFNKFGVRDREHPLFLILNGPPIEYSKGDNFIVMEWGKWNDIDNLKTDIMKLANFFSDDAFIEKLAAAKDVTAWDRLLTFTKEKGVSAIGVGASILGAVL